MRHAVGRPCKRTRHTGHFIRCRQVRQREWEGGVVCHTQLSFYLYASCQRTSGEPALQLLLANTVLPLVSPDFLALFGGTQSSILNALHKLTT